MSDEELYACDHCDHEGDDVELREDPYTREIEGSGDKTYWCDECYMQRALDV